MTMSVEEIRNAAEMHGMSVARFLHEDKKRRRDMIRDASTTLETRERLERAKAENAMALRKRATFIASWLNMVEMAEARQRLLESLQHEIADAEVRIGRITLREISQQVCDRYGVSFADIKSSRRAKSVVQPRFEFFYRGRRETLASLPTIGRFCGGKDHTTVINGVKTYRQWQLMALGKVEPSPYFGAVDASMLLPWRGDADVVGEHGK